MKEVLGLDVGTSRLVAARKAAQGMEFESQLNAFVSIPHNKMTESALGKEGVPFTVDNGQIMVHGNESARFADLLQMETRRPMTKGVLNANESESSAHLGHLIRTLLGNRKPTRVTFTVPAAPLGNQESLTYHEATVTQILTDMGHRPTAINEGLAVIYAEMESSNYSGIGISCGGGLVNVCLAYLSVPVLSFSLPKAGDFIDSSTASITGELATRVRLTKEDSFYLNGSTGSKMQQVLTVYYDDMIKSIVAGLREAFSVARNIPKFSKAIPLVLAGGSALPRGFRDRFEKALRETDFPLSLSEVRVAESPLNTTAKGALVAALADGEAAAATA